MVVLAALSWLISRAARALAAASAALGRLAAALGALGDGCRPGSHPPADPQNAAAPQRPPASSGAATSAAPGSPAPGSMSDVDAQGSPAPGSAGDGDAAQAQSRAAFLRGAGPAYGYGGGGVERELRGEFSRLGRRVYVDHAGATLYSQAQLRAAHEVILLPCPPATSPLPGPPPHACCSRARSACAPS